MDDISCSSCKRNISGGRAAKFDCPNCGKTAIIRCTDCRANAVPYDCDKCGFKGPN